MELFLPDLFIGWARVKGGIPISVKDQHHGQHEKCYFIFALSSR